MRSKLLTLCITINLLAALAIIILPWMPNWSMLVPLSYAILFSPRWLVLILLLPLWWFIRHSKPHQKLITLFCTLVFVQFQDIQFNFLNSAPNSAPGSLTVLTLNAGAGANAKAIAQVVASTAPDVVLLQESSTKLMTQVFGPIWQTECESMLCIASRLPFKKQGSLGRKAFGGWGSFAALYTLTLGPNALSLANVHFETPRSTIMSVLYQTWAWAEIDALHFARNMQASYLYAWAKDQPNLIIGGDFNMTENENIYRVHFSPLKNAISDAGFGINYTKYTRWHGIRIDHVLTSNNIQAIHAETLSDVGGDHRPVLVELVFVQ